jgi:replicative DNA helicase
MTSFEKFGNEFQIKILHYFLSDNDFAIRVIDILHPEFFSNENLQFLYSKIIEHQQKYESIPNSSSLDAIIGTLDGSVDENVKEYLATVVDIFKSTANDQSDKKYVEEQTLEFCKQQAMRDAIMQSIDFLKKEDYEAIFTAVKKALAAGASREIGHDYFEAVASRLLNKRNPISTGMKLLDDYIAGGPSAGELMIIMCATGVGKSMFMVYLACQAMLQNKKVLYYSFEMSESMIGIRADAYFTKIGLTSLLMDTEGVHRAAVKERLIGLKEVCPSAALMIKEFPTKTCTITALKNHINNLQARGFIPDIIFVDYADLMRSTSKYNDKRFELESLIEQLRGMAMELHIPVVTASQANREGLDTSIVKLKHISESLAKAMIADVIISIGRDSELIRETKACYYLAKNRLGRDKVIFSGKFDTSILDFTIDREGFEESSSRGDDLNERVASAVRELLAKKVDEEDE